MASDDTIRLAIDSGRVVTWADGFGRWYASVPATMAHPMGVAKLAIRLELQDREAAGPGKRVPLPVVEPVGPEYDDDAGRVTYREV